MTRPRLTEILTTVAAGVLLWSGTAWGQAQATSNILPTPARPPAASASGTPPHATASNPTLTLPPTHLNAPTATPAPTRLPNAVTHGSSTPDGARPASAPTPITATSTPPAAIPASSAVSARAALKAPQASQFRPSGPITVTADHAELVQGDYALYNGHVVLSSNTMTLNGDRLKLRQQTNGQFTGTLTGAPATMVHSSSGPNDPRVTAHADTVVYDSATQLITLTGNAQLTRGQNVVDGQTIRYDAANHRVQAAGGNGGQVHMVIQPPPAKTSPNAGTAP